MTETSKVQPNQETLWAGKNGERWLANVDRFEGMIKPIGDALIEQAAFEQGEHIIDVGCGAGGTSIEIAQLVGAAGSVTGLDISPVLIAEARKRAEIAGLEQARFVLGDAAIAPLPTMQASGIFSRFGIMFFSNPHAAFSHMHGFLKSGGRLAIACWAPLLENLWMLEVRNILAAHFALPTITPRSPGPFAFAQPVYVKEILETSGFKDITISPWQKNLFIGGFGSTPETAADFLQNALSVAQLPEDLPDSVKMTINSEVIERLKVYQTNYGVQIPASVWLVTAKA